MEKPDMSEEISTVISGILYISGCKPANRLATIEDYMFGGILRLGDMDDFNNIYMKDVIQNVDVMGIVIQDKSTSHFSQTLLNMCIDFIESCTKPVLVHCYAGISRSATVVIAYLMWKQHIGLREARLQLKAKREVIDPNATFIKDLIVFHQSIKH